MNPHRITPPRPFLGDQSPRPPGICRFGANPEGVTETKKPGKSRGSFGLGHWAALRLRPRSAVSCVQSSGQHTASEFERQIGKAPIDTLSPRFQASFRDSHPKMTHSYWRGGDCVFMQYTRNLLDPDSAHDLIRVNFKAKFTTSFGIDITAAV